MGRLWIRESPGLYIDRIAGPRHRYWHFGCRFVADAGSLKGCHQADSLLRQCSTTGFGFHLYAEDHEDYPPPYHLQDTRLETLGVPCPIGWDNLLLDDYLSRNTNVFQCLGNFGLKSVLRKANLVPSTLSIYLIREGINSRILNSSKTLTRSFNFAYNMHPFFSKIKLSQVVYPSDFVLLGDSPGWINFKSPRFAGTGNGLPWIYYPMFDLVYPLYTFNLTCRHVARQTLRFWMDMSKH